MLYVSENGEIELTRGDSAYLKVNVTKDDGEAYEFQNGDSLTLSLKKSTKDEEALMTKTAIASDTFHIKPKDTSGLSFGKYKYDVQLTTADGDVFTVIPPSTFKIAEEVTT